MDLPAHRADRGVMKDHWPERPCWDVWEQTRLADMHHRLGAMAAPVLYDVGAESGDLSALFASWGCRVVLVEPNPRAWPSIRACFEANGLEPAGAFCGFFSDDGEGAADGWERGWCWPEERDRGLPEWPACACDSIDPAHGFLSLATERGMAPRTTLDAFAAQTGLVPDALTIDVEGAELLVLRGAERTLREARPLVWCSLHPAFLREQYATEPEAVLEYMARMGYRARLLAIDHEEHWFFDPC